METNNELQFNQPCYDKEGNFLGWYSRSVAASLLALCRDMNGEWYVLASERGNGAPDFQGYWNLPCGYCEFNETLKETAVRECFEETGVKFDPELLEFFGYNDDPKKTNRQNISFRFLTVVTDKVTSDFRFSKDNNEKDEVGKIAWINLSAIHSFKWAFDHLEQIERAKKMVES